MLCVNHPVYRDRWCVMGPSPYDPTVRTMLFGPADLFQCLDAKRDMERNPGLVEIYARCA